MNDKRNVRLLQVAHRLTAKGYGSAQKTTDAIERIRSELDQLDGWAAAGEAGNGDNSQPEAFMLRRYHWASAREDLRDAIEAIELAVQHLHGVVVGILGHRDDVRICDGRHLEGADVPWTPYSREPDNGWFDPMCANVADATGLCPGCRLRNRRWRLANDLEPLQTLRGEDAA